MKRFYGCVAVTLLAACHRAPDEAIDSEILSAVQQIRAIDNHAHPVRVILNGPPDREFDALPVDNMEPQSDPLALRPNAPATLEAARALYRNMTKPATQHAKADAYPAWVLDQAGVETMLANRIAMGPGIEPPRFRWVPYADALLFPLDNSQLSARNPDRKAFFALEGQVRGRYLNDAGLRAPPATLAEYLARVVTPTLERQKQGGALAEKFEAAYLRSLEFDRVDRAVAERIYTQHIGRGAPPDSDYKALQDFLFWYVAGECGRLGMAVHIHTADGAGGYFQVAGANPLLLEPVLNAPELRRTRFVMLHGGWPFSMEITALLAKPNAYLDFSMQDILRPPAALAATLREWLSFVPEKVLFGTDAYPYSDQLGWEESGWIAARTGREALARALTGMLRDGEVTRARAVELARMVLRDNARRLYGL